MGRTVISALDQNGLPSSFSNASFTFRSSRSFNTSSVGAGPSVTFLLRCFEAGSYTVKVYSRSLMVTDSTWVSSGAALTSATNSLKGTWAARGVSGLTNCQMARNIRISKIHNKSVLCDCFTTSASRRLRQGNKGFVQSHGDGAKEAFHSFGLKFAISSVWRRLRSLSVLWALSRFSSAFHLFWCLYYDASSAHIHHGDPPTGHGNTNSRPMPRCGTPKFPQLSTGQ